MTQFSLYIVRENIRMQIILNGVLSVTLKIYSKSVNPGEAIFESNLPDPSGWWVGIWGSSAGGEIMVC